jgi:glycosyltransferase involved in cell wall biosynthesis
MDSPVFSIVIPTLNRSRLLGVTLRELILQLGTSLVSTEIVVSDNASEDDTASLFQAKGEFADIRAVIHETRVDIDSSFERAVAAARGEYILLFGDDDIPLPGFIHEISKLIAAPEQPAFVYVNRIIGDEALERTTEVAHPSNPYGVSIMTPGELIRRFTHWPGFISCLAFHRKTWTDGGQHGTGYDGFNFLSRIYAGSAGRSVAYLAAPLALQRRGIQSWKKNWPRYWLISMPGLLKNLEDLGIAPGAVAGWRATSINLRNFTIDCLVAAAYGYSPVDPFWKKSRSYQSSSLLKLISLTFQYAVPEFLAAFLYKRSSKMT